ncbi:MAG: hypothetical protein JWN95_1654 [Frankiales bacterium]|nr:hypothetical protein [Frankiales bacterium]
MPRRLVVMTAAGLVATILAGSLLLAVGQHGYGLFLMVGGPLVLTLNVLLVRRGVRRNRGGAAPAILTGRVLAAENAVPAREPRWTGGGNVATDLGRMNAGSPLAVLELAEGALELRFRPRQLAKVFGAGQSRWQPSDLIEICPVRGRLLRVTRGVAIMVAGRPTSYFWTSRPEPLLAVLAQAGFPVAWAERGIKVLG